MAQATFRGTLYNIDPARLEDLLLMPCIIPYMPTPPIRWATQQFGPHPPGWLECRRGRFRVRGRPALGEVQNAADRRRSNAILALYSLVFSGCYVDSSEHPTGAA